MAGTATHLALADWIYNALGFEKIKNMSYFYCGNIAPDAIHAKPDFKREDKKHTHLTEGISGSDFQNPEKMKTYHDRINEFIRIYYNNAGDYKDLYLGYIIHLLSDEAFNINVRERFVEAMKNEGIDQSDKEFFLRIMSDIDNVDIILVQKYPYSRNITDILESVWDYEIRDYVGSTEINNSKRWVIDQYFKGSREKAEPVYYNYEEAVSFIDLTAKDIIKKLSDGNELIKLI